MAKAMRLSKIDDKEVMGKEGRKWERYCLKSVLKRKLQL